VNLDCGGYIPVAQDERRKLLQRSAMFIDSFDAFQITELRLRVISIKVSIGFFGFVFCSAGDQTQGLVDSKQVL
jgi:hypothetical protein